MFGCWCLSWCTVGGEREALTKGKYLFPPGVTGRSEGPWVLEEQGPISKSDWLTSKREVSVSPNSRNSTD